MDRLGFWGQVAQPEYARVLPFQYPLMDRLGFWGRCRRGRAPGRPSFSIR